MADRFHRILVTGASRGIGLEFVRQFLTRSASSTVIAGCRTPASASDLSDLQKHYPQRLHVVALDVGDEQSIVEASAQVKKLVPSIDLVINNAGILKPDHDLADVDWETMIESFKTNTLGPLFLTKHLAGLLKEAKHSMVVNITSGLASISDNRSGGYFSYRASKSALDMMTVNLAHELREQGTTVICVEPGWVKTDMGGSNASTTVDASVDGMITNVIAKVGIEQTGKFYTRHGKEFAW